MGNHYLLKHTTTTEFRGQKHTIHSEVEPVFTGDEEEVFRWIADAQTRASRVLNGIEGAPAPPPFGDSGHEPSDAEEAS